MYFEQISLHLFAINSLIWKHASSNKYRVEQYLTRLPLKENLKDDKTEENTFEILQHSDININNR